MTDQNDTPAIPADLSVETLQAVVELQRTELNRLLREQSRLNDRIDQLLQLHEREQVLRQQMQASLENLVLAQRGAVEGQGALPGFSVGPNAEDLQVRLARTEDRFNALQGAVGDLVAYIERKLPGGDVPAGGSDGYVHVFAPG